jgi:hypothetical protein
MTYDDLNSVSRIARQGNCENIKCCYCYFQENGCTGNIVMPGGDKKLNKELQKMARHVVREQKLKQILNEEKL